MTDNESRSVLDRLEDIEEALREVQSELVNLQGEVDLDPIKQQLDRIEALLRSQARGRA